MAILPLVKDLRLTYAINHAKKLRNLHTDQEISPSTEHSIRPQARGPRIIPQKQGSRQVCFSIGAQIRQVFLFFYDIFFFLSLNPCFLVLLAWGEYDMVYKQVRGCKR